MRELDALCGRWYAWFVRQHEERPIEVADLDAAYERFEDARQWGTDDGEEDAEAYRSLGHAAPCDEPWSMSSYALLPN